MFAPSHPSYAARGAVLCSWVVLVLGLTSGCGDEDDRSSPTAVDDSVPAELVLTTQGERVELPTPVAGCRESEDDPDARVLAVYSGYPPSRESNGFYLMVPAADVEEPLTIELPTDGSDEERVVFAYAGDNEASSSQEDVKGTVEILEAGCEPGDRVRARVDVLLGSEFGDGDPIEVAGGFDAEVVDLEDYFGDEPGGAGG